MSENRNIHELIERSSFGAPEAREAREGVSVERAAELVRRHLESAREAG